MAPGIIGEFERELGDRVSACIDIEGMDGEVSCSWKEMRFGFATCWHWVERVLIGYSGE